MIESVQDNGERPAIALSPWYDPRRLALVWLRYFMWAGLIGGVAGGVLAMLIGFRFVDSTHKLTAALRVVDISQPIAIDPEQGAYTIPALDPRELQSLLVQWQVFERLQPIAETEEEVRDYRRRFDIDFSNEANAFVVSYRGAGTAENAEKVLQTYCQLVIMQAREQVLQRLRHDEDQFRQNVLEAERDLERAKAALGDFRGEHGFVYLEQEIAKRQSRVAVLEERVLEARNRLSDIRHRLAELPAIIADLPPTVSAPTTEAPALHPRLQALRDEVRRLEAVYTDKDPRLIAARRQLASFEEEYGQEVEQVQKLSKMPNPLIARLEEERLMLQLSQPQIERELQEWQERQVDAERELEVMPGLAAGYLQLVTKVDEYTGLLGRLRSRLAEIRIARKLTLDQLQVLNAPNAAYADTSGRGFKLGLLGLAGLVAGLFLGGLVALLFAFRDRCLRNSLDCELLLKAEWVVTMPRGEMSPQQYRVWVQGMAEHLTRRNRSVLFIPSSDPTRAGTVASEMGQQMARSRISTLLICDPELVSQQAGAPGLGEVVAGLDDTRRCIVPLEDHLDLLPMGDPALLLDQVPSGRIEEALQALAKRYGAVLVAPPMGDYPLLNRIAKAVDGCVAIVDPEDRDGWRLVAAVEDMKRPVSLALLTV